MGIQLIPAYSPQARGRSERGFRTWQGRLPQELRIRGVKSVEEANHFLRTVYIAEFNRRFAVAAAESGTAFLPCKRKDLDLVFSLQHERVVARDNTVSLGGRVFQLGRTRLRATLAGCRVCVHEHLDESISITFGPHLVGRFADNDGSFDGSKAVEIPQVRKTAKNAVSLTSLGKPRAKRPRLSHIPTAPTTTDLSMKKKTKIKSGHLTC